MLRFLKILGCFVFMLIASTSWTNSYAAPLLIVDEARTFDAQIILHGYAQECGTGQLYGLGDFDFMHPYPFQVGHYYHFVNVWVFEGDPGKLSLLPSERLDSLSEISGCPQSPVAPTPIPTMVWGCAGFGQCPTPPPDTSPNTVPTPIIQSDPIEGLMVVDGLQLSIPSAGSGQLVTIMYRVLNTGNQTIHIPRLVASVRGPNGDTLGWNAPNADFPAASDIWLQPGQEYTYQQSRTFDAAGSYFVEATRMDSKGNWGGVYPFPRAWLTINSSTQSYSARQIRFNVKDGIVTRLRIQGENQNGVYTTWQSPAPPNGYYYWVDTNGYWWQQTLNLDFDIVGRGTYSCVIDYLNSTTAGDMTPVTYTEGQGCGGDEGSSDNYEVFVQGLYDALNYDDATGVYGLITKANDRLGCLEKIVEGIKGPLAVIGVTTACGQVLLDDLNDILRKYNKTVQWENQSTSGDNQPAPTMVPAYSAPTSVPAFPAGVYISAIQPQPSQPGRNQGVPFSATFVNTTGSPQNYNFVVQIFDANRNKGFGETLVQGITVPVGTTQITSPDNWAVRGPGGCLPFYARAYFQNGDNSRTLFLAPDGSTPTAYFNVC